MKQFSIPRPELLRALSLAGSITDARSTIPILSCVRITAHQDKVWVEATNLDIYFIRQIAVEVPAGANGPVTVVVPFKPLKDFVATAVTNDVTFQAGDDVTLRSGYTSRTIITYPDKDWPEWSEPSEYQSRMAIADDLRAGVEAVQHAISAEAMRYYLNGIYLEPADNALKLVATDGHRMAITQLQSTGTHKKMPGVIFPREAVPVLVNALKDVERQMKPNKPLVTIHLGGPPRPTHVVLDYGADFVIKAKLIDGTYPDYARVMNDSASTISMTVDRASLLAAMKTMPKDRGAKITINGSGKGTIEGKDEDGNVVRSEFSVKNGSNEPVVVGLRAKYVIDALTNVVMTDDVELGAQLHPGPHLMTPIWLKQPGRPHPITLIMPMVP